MQGGDLAWLPFLPDEGRISGKTRHTAVIRLICLKPGVGGRTVVHRVSYRRTRTCSSSSAKQTSGACAAAPGPFMIDSW